MSHLTPAQRRRGGGLAVALLFCLRAVAGPGAELGAEPQQPAVAIQPGRPDASRAAEPAVLSLLQRQLDGLGAATGCEQQYAAHKAQAWVNFGKYAAAEQLPREVQDAARGHARALLEALAQQRRASHDTAELPHARHVRDDLWRGIAQAEQDGRVCAAPKMTAYCEVELAWVDYESGAGGWRHAEPYVRIAEDYCSTAMAAPAPAAAVAPVPAPAPAAAVAPVPAPPPAPPPAAPEPDLTVLFAHDRSALRDIRAPGRAQLEQLAQRWRSGHHGKIHVTGHADLTGHPGYNLRLSARRAATVARELQRLGIPAAAIETGALGARQEVVACARPAEAAERRRYLACLEPNRRVVVHLDEP